MNRWFRRPRLFVSLLTWALTLSLCLALLAFGLLRRAAAELGDQSLRLGPELERWAGRLGALTTLELNGQRMHVGSVTSQQTVSELLTRFEALCTHESGGLIEALAARGFALREDETQLSLGVLHETLGDTAGASGCFARGTHGGAPDLLRRIGIFLASRDLSALGQLRYVYARKTAGGGSHAVVVWSEGPLRVEAMFPSQGDAAGADFVGLPRPVGARRLISAQVQGKPYGLLAYEVAEPDVQAALERYDAQLAQVDYQAIHLPTGVAAALASRVFLRAGVPLQVHSIRHGDQTVIAVLRMGGPLHETFSAAR